MAIKQAWTAKEEAFIVENANLGYRKLWEYSGKTRTLNAWRQKRAHMRDGGMVDSTPRNEQKDRLHRLGIISDLLERSGIDPSEIGKVDKVRLNEYEGFYKDADGNSQKVDMSAAAVVLSPKWANGPAWPVVQPSPSVRVQAGTSRARPMAKEMGVCVILPDSQIGFYRGLTERLHPTHDNRALDIAIQIVRDAKATRVVQIGDTVDFPEISRYRKEPAFARTIQAGIDRATRYQADIRANVHPDCVIDWLEGNHEARLPNFIKDNAGAAFGLRPGNQPDAWPVLSIPVLCRLDELRVTYHAGFPATVLWLSDRLKIIHGYMAKGRGNAASYLDRERESTIWGHTHRREWAERTRDTRNGPVTVMSASPGCLCRIDGVVPSVGSGTDVSGIPMRSTENWQQGLAVVSFTPGDGPFVYEPVAIHEGHAWWRGRHYTASCGLDDHEQPHAKMQPGAKNKAA